MHNPQHATQGGSGATPAAAHTALTVGAVNDPQEAEADAVADHIMRMPADTLVQRQEAGIEEEEKVQRQVMPAFIQRKCAACSAEETVQRQVLPSFIQRKCAQCEEEEKAQRSPLPSFIQRKENGGESKASDAVTSGIRATRGNGRSLPEGTKSFMESRFGTDFSDVRIHTGGYASQLSNDLQAQAFTVGNDIYFNSGKFAPESDSGKHLLAHELTHVVQQSGGIGRKIQRLGANPGCTATQRRDIHQFIFDAGAWVRNALVKLETRPITAQVRAAMTRHFGIAATEANIATIAARLRTARTEMYTVDINCLDAAGHALCADRGGLTLVPGGHAFSICTNIAFGPTADATYRRALVLHEAFHSAFAAMGAADDAYSGWRGHSGTTAGYPGPTPLNNADAYTSLVIDLS
ncbi:DUF4157 domain-containing protein [Chitinophaga agrisoli]|uniref:DUF4157 domain-containing protein n=1 Tax=Chitinophaga agrisoli TaxID=2607653 RepID=A0A5B2VLY6_9BACT|nr:DUF4157 domain-containing protein [Chitinophaga agrisoli]KAA2239287.1 DUF4157 domain-containing protein [Chitinophaga agrisoli]